MHIHVQDILYLTSASKTLNLIHVSTARLLFVHMQGMSENPKGKCPGGQKCRGGRGVECPPGGKQPRGVNVQGVKRGGVNNLGGECRSRG